VLFLLPVACLWCDGRKEQWIHSALRYNRWNPSLKFSRIERTVHGTFGFNSTRFYETVLRNFLLLQDTIFRSECRRTLVPTDRRTLVPVVRRTSSKQSIKDRRDLLFVTGLNDGQCVFSFAFEGMESMAQQRCIDPSDRPLHALLLKSTKAEKT